MWVVSVVVLLGLLKPAQSVFPDEDFLAIWDDNNLFPESTTSTQRPTWGPKKRKRGELVITPIHTPKTVLIETLLGWGCNVPLEFVQGVIADAFPQQPFMSLVEVAALRRTALSPVMRPTWFHTTLLQWPAHLPEAGLLETISVQLPLHVTLSDRALRRSVNMWREFCIQPLREWRAPRDGAPPCSLHSASRMRLSEAQTVAYLRKALSQAQDGIESI